MLVWVVGSGGMLGSAICAVAREAGEEIFDAAPVPWADHESARRTLASDVERFRTAAADREWAVVWAAGSAVVATTSSETDPELAILAGWLEALTGNLPTGSGAAFLTSSAGGVYAGSTSPPFDAMTDPRPISPYGQLKLRQEQTAQRILTDRVPLVIGRFSNLYGTAHDLRKGQGLIPLLCHATLRREPLNLFVSMDTVRDYLLVEDAAVMAWQAVSRAVSEQPEQARVVVIANGQPATVAEVIGTVQNVAHRRVPLALGTHPSARHQTVDLRLTPSREFDDVRRTPLPSGVKRVYGALAGRSG